MLNNSNGIDRLLGPTLILVAHPDDESLACGILLQRIKNPTLIVCTDGAAENDQPWYAKMLKRRERYAKRRSAELREAMTIAAVRSVFTLAGIRDQTLYRSLRLASECIERWIGDRPPGAILSHAFEAGHPDHDACACLAYWAAQRFRAPVWEMPLYHRPTPSAPLVFQKFLNANGCEVVLKPTAEELRRKEEMLARYRSQATVISTFDAAREVFRPQPRYDFGLNPNPALTNYGVCEGTNIGDALKEFRAFVDGMARQESQ